MPDATTQPNSKPNSKPNTKLTSQHAELLVLSVLAEEPSYGYAIAKRVAAQSDNAFKLPPSQLYPLMTRLEKQGMVTPSWEEVHAEGKPSDRDDDSPGRRRKWYRLSGKGKKRLAQRIEAHRRFTALIDTFIPGDGGTLGAAS